MMKINEKILIKYASDTSNIDKEGWLFKKSDLKNEFQKRYCILKGNLLFYFEKKNDKEPLGCILLEGCRIELEDNEKQLYSFKILFSPKSNKNYTFSAETQSLMESWMKSLSSCSIFILRAILCELKKQVEDLESESISKIDTQTNQIYSLSNNEFIRQNNPFDDDLINLSGDRNYMLEQSKNVNKYNQPQICFSKKPFVELHQYYKMHFHKFLNRNNKSNEMNGELIIL